jgi:hypothetical protein
MNGQQPIVLRNLSLVHLVSIAYAGSLEYLVTQWMEDDNFSHGFFVPVITAALIWWRRERIAAAGIVSSWWGLVPVALGLALYVVGELATVYFLQHLSLWLMIVGLALAIAGPRATREMAFPLGYLLTMIPRRRCTAKSVFLLQLVVGAGRRFLQLIRWPSAKAMSSTSADPAASGRSLQRFALSDSVDRPDLVERYLFQNRL